MVLDRSRSIIRSWSRHFHRQLRGAAPNGSATLDYINSSANITLARLDIQRRVVAAVTAHQEQGRKIGYVSKHRNISKGRGRKWNVLKQTHRTVTLNTNCFIELASTPLEPLGVFEGGGGEYVDRFEER